MTLDQLSQTMEVMTSVVNRLRQHLSEQLRDQADQAQQNAPKLPSEQVDSSQGPAHQRKQSIQTSSDPNSQNTAGQTEQEAETVSRNREPFVVEIRQQDESPTRKSDKTLH